MRTPKRDFEIFSLSAIDLFCSAMGAFIVICIVLFPFYRKTSTAEEVAELKQTIAQQQEQIQQLQQNPQQVAALQQTIDQLRQALKNSVQMAVLGISTKKETFVMLVDLSGSMKEYRAIITKTCQTLIESMQEHHKCQIIGYHTPGDATQLHRLSSGLMQMTAANRTRAMQFVEQLMNQLEGTTPTEDALNAALDTPADCVFLLTDGAPTNDAFPEPSQKPEYRQYLAGIVENTTKKNAGRKEIHCIAIGAYDSVPDLVDFLSALAKNNQGQFLGQSK